MKKNNVVDAKEIAAYFLLWAILLCYAVTGLSLLAGVNVGWWQFPSSVALSACLVSFSFRLSDNRWKGCLLGVVIILMCVSLYVWIPDVSFDGNWYHQEIVALLLDGWNPVWDDIPVATIWALHYPKALETVCATVVATFGYLEMGKSVNMMLALSAMLLFKAFLDRRLPGASRVLKWTCGVVALCNPAVLAQLFCFYNDFVIYYLLLWLILLLLRIRAVSKMRNLLTLAGITVFAFGVKLNTAFLISLCWILVYMYYLIVVRKTNDTFRILAIGFLSIVVGGFLLGWHPYMMNVLDYGTPFYPIFGNDDSIDIMSHNTPEIYIGHNRIYNFILSYGGRPHWLGSDIRIGGFGPFTLILLCLSAGVMIENRRKLPFVVKYIAISAFLSCLCFEQTWWARYIPQLWLVPLTAVASLLFIRDGNHRIKWELRGMLLLCLVPVPFVLYPEIRYAVPLQISRNMYFQYYSGKEVCVSIPRPEFQKSAVVTCRLLNERDIAARLVEAGHLATPCLFYPSGLSAFGFVAVECDSTLCSAAWTRMNVKWCDSVPLMPNRPFSDMFTENPPHTIRFGKGAKAMQNCQTETATEVSGFLQVPGMVQIQVPGVPI